MGLIRPSALLFALVMTAPALYRALVTGELDVTSALIRFVIAVPIAALMLAGLRMVTASYGERSKGPAATLVPLQPPGADDPAGPGSPV